MSKKHREKMLTWEQWYQYAFDYAQERGDLLIARNYMTADGKKLGRWIERQRAAYFGKGTYSLCRDQIIWLEQIGMSWKRGERNDWGFWYEKACTYDALHQNLLVPRGEIVDGYALGNWVSEQRKSLKKGNLSEEKKLALEKIGMVWEVQQRRSWEDWYQDATAYYLCHGHLRVPYAYITDNGRALGAWVERQRERYWASGKNFQPEGLHKALTKEQAKKLEAIGMQWIWKKYRGKNI